MTNASISAVPLLRSKFIFVHFYVESVTNISPPDGTIFLGERHLFLGFHSIAISKFTDLEKADPPLIWSLAKPFSRVRWYPVIMKTSCGRRSERCPSFTRYFLLALVNRALLVFWFYSNSTALPTVRTIFLVVMLKYWFYLYSTVKYLLYCSTLRE